MKIMTRLFFALILSSALFGCKSSPQNMGDENSKGGNVEIYIRRHGQNSDQLSPNQKCAEVAEQLLSMDDIVAYSEKSHIIKLTNSSINKFNQQDLTSYSFLMCVSGEMIYSGEIMAAYMSRSSEKVVIMWPGMENDQTAIRIQLGYPNEDFFIGTDPRSNTHIMDSLRSAGKLITTDP